MSVNFTEFPSSQTPHEQPGTRHVVVGPATPIDNTPAETAPTTRESSVLDTPFTPEAPGTAPALKQTHERLAQIVQNPKDFEPAEYHNALTAFTDAIGQSGLVPPDQQKELNELVEQMQNATPEEIVQLLDTMIPKEETPTQTKPALPPTPLATSTPETSVQPEVTPQKAQQATKELKDAAHSTPVDKKKQAEYVNERFAKLKKIFKTLGMVLIFLFGAPILSGLMSMGGGREA